MISSITRGRQAVIKDGSLGFTLADPNGHGMLDMVRFDTTVLAVIADFIRE